MKSLSGVPNVRNAAAKGNEMRILVAFYPCFVSTADSK